MKRARVIKDFFGINNLTNKDISGLFVKTKLPNESISSKFGLLKISRDCSENVEVVHHKDFGKARFDNENMPKNHGQYEPSNTGPLFTTTDITRLYTMSENEAKASGTSQFDEVKASDASPIDGVIKEAVVISELTPERELSDVLSLFQNQNIDKINRYHNQPPLTFYFDTVIKTNDGHQQDSETKSIDVQISESDENDKRAKEEPQVKTFLSHDIDDGSDHTDDVESGVDEFAFDKSIEDKYSPRTAVKGKPLNALEFLDSIRSGKIESKRPRLQDTNAYPLKSRITLDSRGFNDYSRQVPDWERCRRVDIIEYLEKSILYHNYGVLAVNKPYGLASHCESNKDKLDVNDLMQEIAARMRIEKVYLAHRLDKTTTGVLLFATSQDRADHLNKLFKSDQIKKTYWCITRGTPDPPEAIIDIPIGEFSVAGKVRSCLAPENIEKKRQITKRYREARRAITEYSVIQSHKQVSLVEVKTRTGVKHQIRCHLGFGINKPILGDHKYSHVGKIAPQQLPQPVLNLLHLRQSKVRTLPLHLHAKTMVLPSIKPNGQNLFIEAPLPDHFKQNLSALKLLSKDVIKES